MGSSDRKRSARLKAGIIVLLCLSFGTIAGIYTVNRLSKNSMVDLERTITTDADLSIKKIHHQATRNGVKEWDLSADTADLYEAQNEIRFHTIRVDFFSKNGNTIHLTAGRGTLNTKTNDIDMTGNIVAVSKNGTMKTEQLQYQNKRHIIFTDTPVKLNGKTFSIVADSMILFLDTERTELKGHVKGLFSEMLQ